MGVIWPKPCTRITTKVYIQLNCGLHTPQCGVQLLSCIFPNLIDISHSSRSCFVLKNFQVPFGGRPGREAQSFIVRRFLSIAH